MHLLNGFEAFMHDLNEEFLARVGVGVDDVQDYNWYDCYEEEMTPEECFYYFAEDNEEFQMFV